MLQVPVFPPIVMSTISAIVIYELGEIKQTVDSSEPLDASGVK